MEETLPKYNFKKIEDLLSDSARITSDKLSQRTHSQSSFNLKKQSSFQNINPNNYSYRTNKKNSKRQLSNNSNNFTNTISSKNNTSYQTNFNNQIKTMENLINIVKENAFEKHKQEIIDKTIERNELKNNVNILETYVKLNRIAKTNFKSLSKGINKENERLTFQSEKANRESYYFNQLMPEIRKEVDDMKKEIEFRHEETKNLNNEKMLIQKELSHLHDEIKKYNWLNTETFNQKEKIKNTLDLFKNHIIKQKEKLNLQINKTNELMGSLAYLAKKSQIENQY